MGAAQESRHPQDMDNGLLSTAPQVIGVMPVFHESAYVVCTDRAGRQAFCPKLGQDGIYCYGLPDGIKACVAA